MHFLAHYYIDRHALPAFTAGALCPDIFPAFTKIFNRKIAHLALPDVPAESRDFHGGILRHYATDKIFHGHPIFISLVEKIRDAMLREGLSRNTYRISFLAHLAAEMLLDKILMEDDPALLPAYYEQLAKAGDRPFQKYFEWLELGEKVECFFPIFIRFKTVRFLQHLHALEGLVEGLSRTNEKVTRVAISAADRKKIMEVLCNIEPEMRYSRHSLLAI